MRKSAEVFKNALRLILEQYRVTQADLARSTGSSTSAIANLANGKSSPTVETVDKLARAIGCEAWELLVDYEKSTNPKAEIRSLKMHYDELQKKFNGLAEQAVGLMKERNRFEAELALQRRVSSPRVERLDSVETDSSDTQLDDLIARLRSIDKNERHHVDLALQGVERKAAKDGFQPLNGLKGKKA